MKFKFVTMALAMLLITGCRPSKSALPISKDTLLSEHNAQRKTHRKLSLKRDSDLENFAQNHLDVEWNRVGENIAWGPTTESAVTSLWMNSSGHRRNILDEKFSHVGFGFAYSKSGEVYWCAVFGGR
jgi:uncharacterized protein YkwD